MTKTRRGVYDDRPLTWASLTLPSRVMVPIYIGAAYWIGWCYIFGPEARLQGASLTVARELAPMEVWGTIAWALATSILLGFLTRKRGVATLSLCVGGLAYLLWTGIYAAAVLVDPTASMVSPAWPLVAAAAHVATAVSLTRREDPTP